MHRRTFLKRSAVLGGGLFALGPLHALGVRTAQGQDVARAVGYGPLVPKGDLALPAEFNYQVISRQGMPQSDGTLTPGTFDGMGAFPGPHATTILIRNHENRRRAGEFPVVISPPELRYDEDPAYTGGCTKLVVKRNKHDNTYEVIESFGIIGGTDTNCAGGVLPGRKWLTCEEVVNRSAVSGKKHGYVFEVDARSHGPVEALPVVAAGRFAHEAAAWQRDVLYLTEDRNIATQGGACFYRYIPSRRSALYGGDGRLRRLTETKGLLQALKLKNEFRANMDSGRVVGVPYKVEWVTIDDPDHDDDTDLRTDRVPGFTPVRFQAQDKGAAYFDRQEGMWADHDNVFFDCTTGGALDLGQVWAYDPRRRTITLIYESVNNQALENPDNIVIVPETGDLFLQEDGPGAQFIRGLTQTGEIYDFAMSITRETEFAGACFDPDGQTLYVNQYGLRGGGPGGPPDAGAVTYAIYGPFENRKGDLHYRHDEPRFYEEDIPFRRPN